ncbi:uncharacterized protein LOC124362491 [Homalodisca vitripennis]|uniref:uncharacterized protein LOC124362491 n=1 Tax=Homalodisca vitripennis TaxID=197043 RepID=UPI001EE9C490|nr:uncharacterized protein LOC124362491 [Homalodisca vitripennis]
MVNYVYMIILALLMAMTCGWHHHESKLQKRVLRSYGGGRFGLSGVHENTPDGEHSVIYTLPESQGRNNGQYLQERNLFGRQGEHNERIPRVRHHEENQFMSD